MGVSHHPQPTSDSKPTRPRWQFGLRGLMLSFVVASLLFNVMGLLGTVWSLAIAWFLILAAGHVIANVWGSTVPSARDRRSALGHGPGDAASGAGRAAEQRRVRSPLGTSVPQGRVEILGGITGALAGAMLGAVLLSNQYWQTAGYAALALGTGSFGMIGGLFGFLVGSLQHVAVWALREDNVGPKSVSADGPRPLTPAR